ncbi:MAG: LysM peptidoglycan-binding domain-containing protein [Bryobacterales bacterium]|nr:LysM peptidoglycan-binding domain-containing protein [Bryobacterales bacterium]
MAVLLAAVDGTGTGDNAEYAKAYEDSFCHRLKKGWDAATGWYLRGPTTDGMDTADRGRQAAAWVAANRGLAKGVILAGHSRGAAAVIHAAYVLKDAGIDVDYLFLFDAVNMQVLLHTHRIPANVKCVFHAVREPYTRSRPFWGNCGRFCADKSKTTYMEQFFFATHSGVGGVPWQIYYKKIKGEDHPDDEIIKEAWEPVATRVTMKQDRMESARVEAWMFGSVRNAVLNLEGSSTGQPVGGSGGSLPPTGGGGGGTSSTYTVVSGDSLSAITGRLWGDVLLWPILYDANVKTIGPNHNLIKVGQKLSVPDIKKYSPAQREQARTRGRNWR